MAEAEQLDGTRIAINHQLREATRTLGEQLLVRSGRGLQYPSSAYRRALRKDDNWTGLSAKTAAQLRSHVSTLIPNGRMTAAKIFSPCVEGHGS